MWARMGGTAPGCGELACHRHQTLASTTSVPNWRAAYLHPGDDPPPTLEARGSERRRPSDRRACISDRCRPCNRRASTSGQRVREAALLGTR
jgi:hypothetical protein